MHHFVVHRFMKWHKRDYPQSVTMMPQREYWCLGKEEATNQYITEMWPFLKPKDFALVYSNTSCVNPTIL